MMIHDPKKQAALIIDAALPSASSEESSGDPDVGLAQDIIDAVKSGSAEDLAMALRAFHSGSSEEMDELE